MSETQKVRVAVIGAGQWGKNLVRNFHGLAALVAIVDSNVEVLGRCRDLYPGVAAFPSAKVVFDSDEIDAVVIATPAVSHFSLTHEALRSGKDVLVEKPLALTPFEGEKLVRLAGETRRILMVGHLLEYHPAILRLKELVTSGELGRIQYVYSNRLNLGRFRTEENILWSFAPHDISAILALLDEMPSEVTAHGGSYLTPRLADVTVTTLVFPSGVRAHIFVSWLHPFKEQKLVVVGDRRMAVFDDLEATDKLRLFSHRVDWVNRQPVPRPEEAERVPITLAEPLRLECEHFLRAVATRSHPRTDGASAVRVLRILDAAQRSLDAGGGPHRVSPDPSTAYFAHPTAIIDSPVEIGEGTKIWHFTHVMSNARIGRRCTIGQNVLVGSGVVVGDNAKIQNNVSLYTGVILEDDVFCGPSMVFTNVINPRSHVSRKDEFKRTLVRRGGTLGANSTIVCGVTIGEYGFVGAGAVVTRDVPDHALVIGNPARHVGWMCRCGVRLPLGLDGEDGVETVCAACGAKFRRRGSALQAV